MKVNQESALPKSRLDIFGNDTNGIAKEEYRRNFTAFTIILLG